MGLFDEYLDRVVKQEPTPARELALVQQIAEEHKVTVMNEQLQKIYEEHNGKDPHSDPAEQCQCEHCNAYREAYAK